MLKSASIKVPSERAALSTRARCGERTMLLFLVPAQKYFRARKGWVSERSCCHSSGGDMAALSTRSTVSHLERQSLPKQDKGFGGGDQTIKHWAGGMM